MESQCSTLECDQRWSRWLVSCWSTSSSPLCCWFLWSTQVRNTECLIWRYLGDICLVRQISARHNILLDTIGPRPEEVDCYQNTVFYFWLTITSFLVCSLLELLCHLLYSHYVRYNSILNVKCLTSHSSFIPGKISLLVLSQSVIRTLPAVSVLTHWPASSTAETKVSIFLSIFPIYFSQ